MIGTFFGGPLVTAYLLTRNYQMLEKTEMSRKIWIFCIALFLLSLLLSFSIFENIPAIVYTLAYTALGYFAAQKLQGESIRNHVAEGGALHSNWKTLLIGIMVTAIFVVMALIFFFLLELWMNYQ